MQSMDMPTIALCFLKNENLMITMLQLMQMTNRAGAMLGYTIAISQPNKEESKNRYNIVADVYVPIMA
ncbi:MAG: hypothetical protein OEV85_14890 [Candidatus Thorarchaeota archaeon]|nr:hypothetical protein [Candidatus Thorarchaeota archaeon]